MVEHRILTTENVPFTFRVASVGSRVLAAEIDFAMIAALLVVGFLFSCAVEGLVGFRFENFQIGLQGLGLATFAIWGLILIPLYFTLSEWKWAGQTIGKRALGIRVVQMNGVQVTFFQSLVRNLVRFIDILPAFFLVGLVVAACNRQSRRLGDLAAGTLVVFVERKPPPLRFFLEPHQEAIPERELVWRQRLGTLTKEQKQTILDLCVRRDQLRLKDRTRLFQAVASYLEDRLQIAKEMNQSDERYVQQAAAILTRGSGP